LPKNPLRSVIYEGGVLAIAVVKVQHIPGVGAVKEGKVLEEGQVVHPNSAFVILAGEWGFEVKSVSLMA
jgi:hypothetical protein